MKFKIYALSIMSAALAFQASRAATDFPFPFQSKRVVKLSNNGNALEIHLSKDGSKIAVRATVKNTTSYAWNSDDIVADVSITRGTATLNPKDQPAVDHENDMIPVGAGARAVALEAIPEGTDANIVVSVQLVDRLDQTPRGEPVSGTISLQP